MAPDNDARDPAAGMSLHRHGLGFLTAGLLAFATDALVLEAGVRHFGLSPLLARIAAIAVAMLVGWLAHRRLTFAILTKPTAIEFARYVLAGAMAAFINYVLFALLLLTLPAMHRLIALVVASASAMVFSYVAMRYAVFRRS